MLNVETMVRRVYFSVLSPFYAPEFVNVTEIWYVLNRDVTKPNTNKYVCHSQALGRNQ